jgi:hypothetical protein
MPLPFSAFIVIISGGTCAVPSGSGVYRFSQEIEKSPK